MGKYSKDYYERNKETIRLKSHEYYLTTKDLVNQRSKERYLKRKQLDPEFYKEAYKNFVKSSSVSRRLIQGAKARAKNQGLSFDICEQDVIVPEVCPVLNIPLYVSEGRLSDNSPTLDRVNNSKGYIKGNISVISWRANNLKNDASVEELEAVVEYMKRYSDE